MTDTASEPGIGLLLFILVAFPIAFTAIWSFVCVLMSLVGGWWRLSGRFRTALPAPVPTESGFYAGMGLANYKQVLELGFTEDGLDLRIMPLFRPGHPPLRIPWSEVRHEGPAFSLWGRFVKLRLGEGGPVLRLPEEVWARSGR